MHPSGRTRRTVPHEPTPGRQVEQRLGGDAAAGLALDYLMFLPRDYGRDERRWPLMLFLHGAGERGHNLQQVKKNGPPRLVERDPDFPFIVVSPQCPPSVWWVEPHQQRLLGQLLDDVTARYAIDEDRIYLTGISMGGFGSWLLAGTHPERFAAVVPICGGGRPEDAPRLAQLPIWAFHGARDNIVPLECSTEMVDAIRDVGGDVRLTVYPDAAHDSWTRTYDDSQLYEWLLAHCRRERRSPPPK